MTEGLIEKAGLTGSGTSGTNRGKALEARRAWPILDPNAVLPRIKLLRDEPKQFDFGYVGLNIAANFYRHIAVAKPQQFDDFANTLYSSGMAFLGMRKVNPSADLRNIDYGELAVNTRPAAPAQLEWMLLVALRDDESWRSDAEGMDYPTTLLAGVREYEDYFTSTGWYLSVEFENDKARATIEGLAPDADTQVTIWIKTSDSGIALMGPVMMRAITSPIVYDTATGRVTYTFWHTGSDEFHYDEKIADFEATYLGATIAQLKPAGP